MADEKSVEATYFVYSRSTESVVAGRPCPIDTEYIEELRRLEFNSPRS
jgi:hypothetical protein